MDLNLKHLYYFYVVAKEGSIKSAAETLFVSQPTISDQIKLLEEHLECKLFDRKNRSLYLNHNGKLAMEYAEQIFEISKELVARLKYSIQPPKKTLDIGMTYNMSNFFSHESLLPFLEKKDLAVNIIEDNRAALLSYLESGEVDLFFTDKRDPQMHSMTSYVFGTNKVFAVAHKSFKKQVANFPEDLHGVPYYSFDNESALKYEADMYFSKHEILPQFLGSAGDIDFLELITKKGIAFTVVPEVAKNRFCLNKDIKVLGELKDLQTNVWAITKKSASETIKKVLNQ